MRDSIILRRQIPSVLATGILLIVLLLGCIGCNSSADSDSESSDCPESAELLDLIERFFTFPGMAEAPQIMVNEIPDDFPLDIPIPEKAEVIGSMAMNMMNGPKSTQIMLDVPGEPEKVLEFYRDHLLDAGWEERSYSHEEGFTASGMGESADFRSKSGSGGAFQVLAFSRENTSDVRLVLTMTVPGDDMGTEAPTPPPASSGSEESQPVLPSLEAPEEASQWGTYHGGADDMSSWGGSSAGDAPMDTSAQSRYSSANLETVLSLEQLQSYYTDLLKKADWAVDISGVNYPMAWSTWSFNDYLGNQWAGFLLIRDLDQEDSKQLYLRADLVQFAEGVSEVPRSYGSWATAEPQAIPYPTSRPPECEASPENSKFMIRVSGPAGMEFLGSVIHEVECSKGSEMQVMDISGTIGDDGGPLEFVASGIYIGCGIRSKTPDKPMTVVLLKDGIEIDRAETTAEDPYEVSVDYYPPDVQWEENEVDGAHAGTAVPSTKVDSHPSDE
ncbi:MAG: hypothetical protein HOC20_10675 [Chloroflexi bacterium]|jgi:hypothetical protein|nr:hypothetical protein [Chloroflexota bacterium]